MSTARAVVFKGLVDIVVRGGGLITFSVLARYAGPDGYGAYSQVNTVVGLAIPIASLGLSGAMVRFFAKRDWTPATRADFVRVLGVVAFGAGFAGFAISWAAPQLNVLFLKWPDGEALFRWGGGLVLAGTLVQFQLDFLRARMRLILFCLIQLADALLLVGATLLLPAGFGLVTLIQVVLTGRLVLFATVMLGYWNWDRPRLHGDSGKPLRLGRMVAFGMPLAISGLGLWMMNLVDRLVIGHYLSAAELGLYAAASTIAGMIAAANAPLMLPLLPRLMQALGDEARVMEDIRTFHRYIALTMVPAAAFLIAIIQPLLVLMGGAAFSVPTELIALLVLALLFQQWNSIAPYYLMCRDRVTFMQNMWLFMGSLNLLGNLLAVPRFGLMGSAAVTFVTFFALDLAFFLYAQKLIDLKSGYQFALSLKAGIASAVAYVAAVLVLENMGPTVPALALATSLFGAIYVGLMLALGEIGKTEARLLAKAFFPNRLS